MTDTDMTLEEAIKICAEFADHVTSAKARAIRTLLAQVRWHDVETAPAPQSGAWFVGSFSNGNGIAQYDVVRHVKSGDLRYCWQPREGSAWRNDLLKSWLPLPKPPVQS